MRRDLTPIMAAVEAEFQDNFWFVVASFAKDGYASGTTAKILGFSGQDVFRRLQARHGVCITWPRHGQDNANKEPRGEYTAEREARRIRSRYGKVSSSRG